MTAPTDVPGMLALVLFAPADGSGNAMAALLFQIVAFIAIFYFIMIRPQARQRKQQQESLFALKRGDEVVTAGGIVGEVVHIKETSKDGKAEKTLEDRVTIRSGESRLVVERGRIARVNAATTGAATPAS
jgi:preprotein translocase subunit YajC